MKYICKTISPTSLVKYSTDCIVAGIYNDGRLSPGAKILDKITDKAISQRLKYGDCGGDIGQSLLLYDLPKLRCKRVLIIGCGAQALVSTEDLKNLIQTTVKAIGTLNIRSVACLFDHLKVTEQKATWVLRQCTLYAEYSLQQNEFLSAHTRATSTCKHWHWLQQKPVSVVPCQQALAQAMAMTQGIKLTKMLGNLPANICTPSYLAKEARQLARQYPKLTTKVLNVAQMQQLGMGALLAVGQGSQQAPKLVELHYRGNRTTSAPIVLIGKGITFDSGGISIKPSAALDEMKFDMLGAATVLGTIKSIAELKLPIHVIGLLATAENMPSDRAVKPGDIVKSLAGKTIEILNTDAEGRLVLCDAIAYSKRFKPRSVIDIATLTGAAIVALGSDIGALMANDDNLSQQLLTAAQQASEPLWRLPLHPKYHQKLKSNFADLANIGSDREAGTIVAGCFLQNFADPLNWAHLDIAGIGWQSGKAKGASGRPVAALTQYLINQCSHQS